MTPTGEQSELHMAADRRWVHRFAIVQVVMTFALIVLGGTVTSKGAGLAVPDWPTTFGYNMFGVPLVLWIGRGGVFWEHSHRLLGSFVGLASIIMLMLLWTPWLTRRVPYRFQGLSLRRFDASRLIDRRWLRWLAVAALVLVTWQGIMGGLRVTQIDYRWGIVHGVVAQIYLCLTVLIAAATSRWWLAAASTPLSPRERAGVRGSAAPDGAAGPAANGQRAHQAGDVGHDSHSATIQSSPHPCPLPSGEGVRWLRALGVVLLGVLLVQLGLGAATRHMEAGVAIYDFPASYGRVAPPLSQGAIDQALSELPYDHDVFTRSRGAAPFTVAQVAVHFAHRVWAIAVVVAVLYAATRFVRAFATERRITRPTALLVVLLIVQVALGASVIWTGRHEHTATSHQATGAIVLAVAALLVFRIFHLTHALPHTTARRTTAVKPMAMRLEGAGA